MSKELWPKCYSKLNNDKLLDNAATASQHKSLVDNESLRECIVLNVINPLKIEIKRLRRFLEKRIVELKDYDKSDGGYHLRRVGLEAEHLLRDPTWFLGRNLWLEEKDSNE